MVVAGSRGTARAASLVVAALLVVTACASGARQTAGAAGTHGPARPGAGPAPDHVVVVVFENKDADSVIGNTSATYLNALAARGRTFTHAHAETHPSQPNYLALFAGDALVPDNACP